jgi:UDP-2,3-diacylglucosamine hydrolase
MKKDTLYFISDAHFGLPFVGEEKRESLFFTLLESLKDRMAALYILGDLFDFWIEYRSVIRFDYFRILCALRNLVDSGVEVHYLPGNHDFALGPFFKEQTGIITHQDTLQIRLQGKMVYMYHGDGLVKSDYGYRFLKKVLRNPFNQKMFKLLHPNIGIWLGTSSSWSSRKRSAHRITAAHLEEYRQCARNELRQGSDIVMYGHTHIPEITRYPEGVFCNTGSWLGNYSYASMRDGELNLYRFQHGLSAEVFPVIDRK